MTVTSELSAELSAELPAGLELLAGARWLPGPDEVPALPGFIASSFAPLAAYVARACLTAHHGSPPVAPPRGGRTALVIASASGDLGTTVALAEAVDAGTRVPPLLFFQAVPNAVAGHIAGQWGLGGPVVCVSPAGDALAEACAVVSLLVRDGDADEALVLLVEQADPHDTDGDRATAVLVRATPAPSTHDEGAHA
jgi:3-oxoacyl-(acyl-carrier-protein) synthase